MKMVGRLAAVAAVGALTVAVPAAAEPPHASHPAHPSKSRKCTPHKVAYAASGTVVNWAATQNSDGTWTGTVTVQVRRANHHAASAKGTSVTYTLTNAKVRLGHGVTNPPAAASRVQVMGKITALAKKCNQTGFTPTITIKRASVHTAHMA